MRSGVELGHAERVETPAGAAFLSPESFRRFQARIQSLKAVAMIVFWSPSRRARLLRPITGLTIAGLGGVDMLARAAALVVREGLYRHIVVLPLEYRSTDDMIWGFSDPLDTSPVGPWLARTPYFRTRTDLRFSTAKQADFCSAGIPGSIRI